MFGLSAKEKKITELGNLAASFGEKGLGAGLEGLMALRSLAQENQIPIGEVVRAGVQTIRQDISSFFISSKEAQVAFDLRLREFNLTFFLKSWLPPQKNSI